MFKTEELNPIVDSIEHKIRECICSKLFGDGSQKWEEIIPSDIVDKVNSRITGHLKRFKHINREKYDGVKAKIEFCDVLDYEKIMVSKTNWSAFESLFQSKVYVETSFRSFGDLRNCLKHSREYDELILDQGLAACEWFNSTLPDGEDASSKKGSANQTKEIGVADGGGTTSAGSLIENFKEVDNLSHGAFELFVGQVLEASGWSDIVHTKVGKEYKHGDGGVDFFCKRNKKSFAVEVKHTSTDNTIGVAALNQLVTGAKLAKVKNLILVSNGFFSSEVVARALMLGVELLDRDRIQNLWVEKHSEIGRNIRPRVYQQAVITEINTAISNGKNRFLVEMATGLGKTYTIAHMVRSLFDKFPERELKVLFIAHQFELIAQAASAFKNVFGIGTYSYSACFDGADPEDTTFVFATFDTMRQKLQRMDKEHFDIVIVDEAHHTAARTYSAVVAHFEPQFTFGLTATPYRTDNQDVLEYFGGADGHVGKYDLAWALKHNKLAFPKYTVYLDDIEQGKLDSLALGMSIADVDKHIFLEKKDVEIRAIIEALIDEKKIKNPKAIVFCKNIKHVRNMMSHFDPEDATFVDSKMKSSERRNNIAFFREGTAKYIFVCDLFNEGIDIPETNILVFLRNTDSRIIWLQQLGRGLRKTKNKEFVDVLDFVGSFRRLMEINELQRDIHSTKLSRKDLELPPSSSPHHDNTLNVEFTEMAAQAITLIKDFQLKLSTKTKLQEALEKSVELHKGIPGIDSIETEIMGISNDQISTFFGSYMTYIQSCASAKKHSSYFKDLCFSFVKEFTDKNGFIPAPGTISVLSKRNGLLAFSELQVVRFIESSKPIQKYIREYTGNMDVLQQTTAVETPQKDTRRSSASGLTPKQQNLIKKTRFRVSEINDIIDLEEDLKQEIRDEFISFFSFLQILKKYND